MLDFDRLTIFQANLSEIGIISGIFTGKLIIYTTV